MEHQRKLFQQRGYSEDLLPKTQSQRTWKTFNYFTLWMGSVHNVPNYVMVGGFFILGLSTFSIMLAIILSAFFIAAVMVLNGAAGSKYGVPFAMILRASYGVRGALFPGLLRGGIAAIMWFGLQCYAGSLACLILIGKIWPGFLTNGVSIMGRYGIPCIGFGPGHEDQAHAPNERTWKSEMVKAAAMYALIPTIYMNRIINK